MSTGLQSTRTILLKDGERKQKCGDSVILVIDFFVVFFFFFFN